MKDIELVQVCVALCEDGKTIQVDGYDAAERCWTQNFLLPCAIAEEHLLVAEWLAVAAARPDKWWLLDGIGWPGARR